MRSSAVVHELIYVQGRVIKEKQICTEVLGLYVKEVRMTQVRGGQDHTGALTRPSLLLLEAWLLPLKVLLLVVLFCLAFFPVKLMLNENVLFYLEIYEFFSPLNLKCYTGFDLQENYFANTCFIDPMSSNISSFIHGKSSETILPFLEP